MNIKVKIDNDYVEFPDQQPRIVNGSTLVPVRNIFEQMGFNVEWTAGDGCDPKGKVTITNDEHTLIINEGLTTFTVDGQTYNHSNEVAPKIIGGRLMVAIRNVLERIGCFVDWNDATETVIVSTERLYSIEDITTNSSSLLVIGGYVNWKVIRTKVEYIRPRIINQPIINTDYVGINGGFFSAADYTVSPCVSPPNGGGRGISWNKGAGDNYLYNGTAAKHISRGTLFICKNGDEFDARVVSVAQANDVFDLVPKADIIAMIGGGELALGANDTDWYDNVYLAEDWELSHGFDTSDLPARRTGIGIKTENGERIAYLAVSKNAAVLADLRTLFSDELRCDSGIFLDGSGSSQYRYIDENGQVVEDGGSDYTSRYIWNMVKITKES